ncbi:MAG: hypothetical protein ACIAXF_14410 [Phycisphaerales bacterium JB063]
MGLPRRMIVIAWLGVIALMFAVPPHTHTRVGGVSYLTIINPQNSARPGHPVVLWWLLALQVAVAAGVAFYLIRMFRPPNGGCRSCGYDLRGTPTGLCPECGQVNDLTPTNTQSTWHETGRTLVTFVLSLLAFLMAMGVVIPIVDPGGGASGHNTRAAVTLGDRITSAICFAIPTVLLGLAGIYILRRKPTQSGEPTSPADSQRPAPRE